MELDRLMLATGPALKTWSTGPTNWRLVIEVMSNWWLTKSAIIYIQIDKLSANLNLLNCAKYTNVNSIKQTALIWMERDGLTLATGPTLET